MGIPPAQTPNIHFSCSSPLPPPPPPPPPPPSPPARPHAARRPGRRTVLVSAHEGLRRQRPPPRHRERVVTVRAQLRRWARWLSPGIGVKRWGLLMALGVLLGRAGAALTVKLKELG